MKKTFFVALFVVFVSGCSSTGNLGLVTKNMAKPTELIETQISFTEIGPVKGTSCRYFVLGLIPFGNGTLSKAVDKALKGTDGDALVNVSVTTSLYGFVPIYQLLGFSCTTVQGVAIDIQ